MSDRKIRSNKIGARCLTRQEAGLILPTYEQIYEQIDNFRREKNIVSGNDQKTNNIGIIGVRGAGKTSILKTIRTQLEKDGERDKENKDGGKKEEKKPQDIILPIIVPENMSESGTLMAAVLGMLKDIVSKRVEEENDRKKNSDCIKKNELQEIYHNVLRQYTYIQKEYRDILIQQYTTENDYVRSSAKLFNSDTEFIKQFNKLIDKLTESKEGDQSLLVLFIDDIDLSTWRCMDVVKTLLSYLANKSIVTFISGDLETFEEALTLEFLRQEKVMEGDVLEKTMLAKGAGEKTLLESKKQLAYEYLKKILPPVYRHNIKEWSLEERGKYCIRNSEDGKKSTDGKESTDGTDLSGLLDEALRGWIDPAFFRYAESGNTKGIIPYTYHLFDNTSRGLNNVYNVLSRIVESRETEKGNNSKEDCLKEKKQLLDTIVASKQIYNQYRNEIQTRMIVIGAVPESSKIYFDNACAIIYGKEENDQKKQDYKMKDPVERFSLFILVDFAARILYENKYSGIIEKDESYQNMKQEAVWDLFWYPVIAEKVMDMKEYDFFKNEGIRNKVNILTDINFNFLKKGDLVFNLAYYKNLPLDRILLMFQKNKIDYSPADLDQDVLSAFWKAVSSVAEVNGMTAVQKGGEYFYKFKRELEPFLSEFSRFREQNIIIRLFDKECVDIIEKTVGLHDQDYLQRVLQNMIAKLLEDEIKNERGEWEKVDPGRAWMSPSYAPDKNTNAENMKRRIVILQTIHEEKLWKEEMVEASVEYLKREIDIYLKNIVKELDERADTEWILDTSGAEEDWKKFMNTYTGGSNTKANQTKRMVGELLPKGDNQKATFAKGVSFQTCQDIIIILKQLSQNNRVWYGQYDAWTIERDLWEAWVRPADGWNPPEKYSYIRFLFQCSYRYKRATEYAGDNMEYAKLLQEIAEGISKAHKNAYEKVQSTFMERLNEGLKKNEEEIVNDEEFNELFS